MKSKRHVPRVANFLLLVLSCVTIAHAQAKHLAPHATVPRQSGPPDVLADSCFHKLFANEYVRALRLQIAPHQSTAIDRRPHDYLIIPLDYVDMETTGQQGNAFDFEMRAGQMQVVQLSALSHQLSAKPCGRGRLARELLPNLKVKCIDRRKPRSGARIKPTA